MMKWPQRKVNEEMNLYSRLKKDLVRKSYARISAVKEESVSGIYHCWDDKGQGEMLTRPRRAPPV